MEFLNVALAPAIRVSPPLGAEGQTDGDTERHGDTQIGWRNNGVCEDGEWFLREARSIRGHVGACGIEIVCAGHVTI